MLILTIKRRTSWGPFTGDVFPSSSTLSGPRFFALAFSCFSELQVFSGTLRRTSLSAIVAGKGRLGVGFRSAIRTEKGSLILSL